MSENESLKIIKVNDKKPDFSLDDYKSALYTGLFYSFGLVLGSYFYKLAQSERLNNIIEIKDDSLLLLFLSEFCIYFAIFLVTAFLGFCLIGKPVIYTIPVFIGVGTGMRLAYYFINFSGKGVGYSLIMIVPYITLFVTVISYTIDNSSRLMNNLISVTKGEGDNKIVLSPYLKNYLIYSLMIAIVTLIDSALTKLLFSIVTI